MKNTTKLQKVEATPAPIRQQVDATDVDLMRPWRIALFVKKMQVKLVIDIVNTVSIGRMDPNSDIVPDIDLRPFYAEQLGVSRRHLILKLHESRVVIIDNQSSNGTILNGSRLIPHEPYFIRHADDLVLGALEFQVEFLINPLE